MAPTSLKPSATLQNSSAEFFMHRCLQLADWGTGFTAPNPLVGAMLVHGDRVIGEGYHRQYGQAHAEVNCLQSVRQANRQLIPFSTLYVSLEPCCHFGQTPPCTDLILQERIPHVVIGCRDPFPLVNGKGIEKLKAAGLKVDFPVLEDLAREKNRRFFTFHEQHRPYIVLKWAETANHKISSTGGRVFISNNRTNRLVHKWRTEEAAILVGTQTALLDNPELTARWWPGKNPVRVVLDQNLRLPHTLKLFDGSVKTIVLNGQKEGQEGSLIYKKMPSGLTIVHGMLDTLYDLQITSVLVEGGARLLQSFMDANSWDEIRIVTNEDLEIPAGIPAPEFRRARLSKTYPLGTDMIRNYVQHKDSL